MLAQFEHNENRFIVPMMVKVKNIPIILETRFGISIFGSQLVSLGMVTT